MRALDGDEGTQQEQPKRKADRIVRATAEERAAMAKQDVAWWRAHWAAEDARTGRGRRMRRLGGEDG